MYFLVFNGPKTAPFQLKATFNLTGVRLESQIHQQAANQPITQKKNNDNCHIQIFNEFTSTL